MKSNNPNITPTIKFEVVSNPIKLVKKPIKLGNTPTSSISPIAASQNKEYFTGNLFLLINLKIIKIYTIENITNKILKLVLIISPFFLLIILKLSH